MGRRTRKERDSRPIKVLDLVTTLARVCGSDDQCCSRTRFDILFCLCCHRYVDARERDDQKHFEMRRRNSRKVIRTKRCGTATHERHSRLHTGSRIREESQGGGVGKLCVAVQPSSSASSGFYPCRRSSGYSNWGTIESMLDQLIRDNG